MKKLLSKIFSRLVITLLLIALQVAWLLYFFVVLTKHASWINPLFTAFSLIMLLYVVNKNENPAYKIGWIILISFVPIFGGLLYLFYGNKRPAQKMRITLAKELRKTKPLLKQDEALLKKIEPRLGATANYVAKHGAYPAWENTSTQYFPIGEAMYQAMLEELEKAEHYIFLEYFIIAQDSMWSGILKILERKAAQGVDVRLIYDDMGSVGILPAGYAKQMEKKGIHCLAFNPFVPFLSLVMNHRDHRKIMVIDGHTAFNGGINLADEYINKLKKHGHWKDSGIMLRGEAVWNFTIMFLEMWNAFKPTDENFERFRPHEYHKTSFESDGFVQPFGDSPLDDEPLSENVYIDILSQAQNYVYIFTPYLIIDNELQTALCLAAKRGVDVRIATPGIPDKKIVFQLTRSYYKPLLEAGVKIYEYTPGFLHSKSYTCDDKIAVVGTINMDYRSLYLHFECGTLLYNTQSILDLKEDNLRTFAVCREISLKDYKNRMLRNLTCAVLRVFAPLF